MSDGAAVRKGDPIATIRIEEALHEVTALVQGRLSITIGVDLHFMMGLTVSGRSMT